MSHDRPPPLSALGVRTYVSLSGLESVLTQLHTSAHLDFQVSRRTLKRRRDEAIHVQTRYCVTCAYILVNVTSNTPNKIVTGSYGMRHHTD